jgi:hypothetical protein
MHEFDIDACAESFGECSLRTERSADGKRAAAGDGDGAGGNSTKKNLYVARVSVLLMRCYLVAGLGAAWKLSNADARFGNVGMASRRRVTLSASYTRPGGQTRRRLPPLRVSPVH